MKTTYTPGTNLTFLRSFLLLFFLSGILSINSRAQNNRGGHQGNRADGNNGASIQPDRSLLSPQQQTQEYGIRRAAPGNTGFNRYNTPQAQQNKDAYNRAITSSEKREYADRGNAHPNSYDNRVDGITNRITRDRNNAPSNATSHQTNNNYNGSSARERPSNINSARPDYYTTQSGNTHPATGYYNGKQENGGYRNGYYGGNSNRSPVYNAYNPNWRHAYVPRRNSVYKTLPASYTSINFGGYGYRYWDGIYYRPYNNTFRVVAPPIGIYINNLPVGYRRIYVRNNPFYYFNGTYYDYRNNYYSVVAPPVGAVVESIPDGFEKLFINGETYYIVDGTQYKPVIQRNGEIWYEVIRSN